jgi:hypothetical protein
VSRRARPTLAAAALALAGCAQFLEYTGELTDDRTGRTLFVTVPATIGGFAGFVVGIPVDVVALPITATVYAMERAQDPVNANFLRTAIVPSFVLMRLGTLLAVPFDAVEWAAYRAWLPPSTLNEQEQAEYELQLDEETLPQYPVTPIYPRREAGPTSRR